LVFQIVTGMVLINQASDLIAKSYCIMKRRENTVLMFFAVSMIFYTFPRLKQ